MAPVPELQNIVVPLPNGATSPRTLGRKGDGKQQSLNKNLHNHNNSHLIPLATFARAWAHYNTTLEGPHFHE